MLTYEKDVVPVKMTAREAHKRSVGTEEDYIELLIDVYNFINEEVDNHNTSIDYWIDSLYLADRVFNELVKQGYNVNLEKDMGADKVWHLSIEWENVDLDPNKNTFYLWRVQKPKTALAIWFIPMRPNKKADLGILGIKVLLLIQKYISLLPLKTLKKHLNG